MASIHPRESRDGTITYQVRFRVGGGRGAKVETERFEDAGAAEDFQRLVDDAGQQWPPGWIKGNGFVDAETSYRFRDFALKVMAERLGVEDRTRRTNIKRLEMYVFPTFGECDVRSASHFSRSTVRQWIRVMQTTMVTRGPKPRSGQGKAVPKPMSPGTLIQIFWLLSCILDEAIQHEPALRTNNPCTALIPELPRLDDETDDDVEFLEPYEIAMLLDACFEERQEELLVVVKYGTGMRWGELTGLQAQDVVGLHTARPRLRVQRAWKRREDGTPYLGVPKSRGGRRTIRISATVVNALIELGVERKSRGDLLFTDGVGGRVRYNTFLRHWHAAVRLAQERGLTKSPTPHDLRHSHAAALISAGYPLTYVQRRLGHATIQITSDTYGHLLPETDHDAMETIETALAGTRPGLRAVS